MTLKELIWDYLDLIGLFGLGLFVYALGILTMDGYIALAEDAGLPNAIGLCIAAMGVIMMVFGWAFCRFRKLKEKIEILKGRLDYLEDKIYSGSGNDGKDN